MTFQDEIEKVCSERFVLARLEPARFINDFLSNPSANIYTMSLPGFVISKVQRSGSDLFKVTTPSVDGDWSFDESTGLLTIYAIDPPDTTDNVFVVFYYLFYATDYDREYPQDVTSGTNRIWNGRITNNPSVNQDVKNGVTSSIITSSSSSVVLANADFQFQNYLTDKDSVANKNADIWIVVNSQIEKLFSGKIVSISSSSNSITLGVNDSLNVLLNEPAYLGEDTNKIIGNLTEHPNIRESDIGRPIPLIYGRSSSVSVMRGQLGLRRSFITEDTPYRGLMTDDDESTPTITLCRLPNGVSLFTKSIDSSNFPQAVGVREVRRFFGPSSSTQIGVADSSIFWGSIQISGHDEEIEVGDTFEYVSGGVTYDAVIARIHFTTGPDETNVGFYSEQNAATGNITIDSMDITAYPSIVVYNSGATENYDSGFSLTYDSFVLLPNRDYTVSTETLNNSTLYKVTFLTNWQNRAGFIQNLRFVSISGFESQFYTPDRQNTRQMEIIYKVHTDDSLSNHSDTVKHIMQSSGVQIESSSFANAKSAFDGDVQFSIPFIGETKFGNLKTYLESILRSCLSIVYINTAGESEYSLITPVSSGSLITENETIDNISLKLSYRDIKTKIIYNNKHNSYKGLFDRYSVETIIEDKTSKFLHQTESTANIEHVLRDISVSNRHLLRLDLIKNRYAEYTYTTASKDLLIDINDDVTVSDKLVLGGTGSVNSKVTAFTKDNEKVTITVTDLLGL